MRPPSVRRGRGERSSGRNRAPLSHALVSILLCAAPVLYPTMQVFSWATFALVMGLWVASLNVVWGYAGQFSMAQPALGAVAGYTYAMLRTHTDVGVASAVGLGLCCSVLSAGFLSIAAIRTRDFYFSILTLAFGLIVVAVFVNWELAGRTSGLSVSRVQDLPTIDVGGLRWELFSPLGGFYLLVAICFILTNAFCVWLAHSPLGGAMFAVRDDEPLARALGIRPLEVKTLAFLVSALIAGGGGILGSFAYQLVVPELFGFHALLVPILLLVLAGRGNPSAPALAAAIYFVLYQAAPVEGYWRDGIIGAVVIVFALVAPAGLAGAASGWSGRLLKRRRSGGRPTSPDADSATEAAAESLAPLVADREH